MVRIIEPSLAQLEASAPHLVACTYFSDERPLQGLAGLVDWRLAGRLSAQLKSQFVRGEAQEALLIPPRPRFGVDKLIVIGLGAIRAFDDQVFQNAIHRILSVAEGLRCTNVAVELPGRSVGAIDAARSADLALAFAGESLLAQALWLVEDERDHAVIHARVDAHARKMVLG